MTYREEGLRDVRKPGPSTGPGPFWVDYEEG